jgi:D-2-hydroxyacid dehydrogenase (NADP+)
MSKTKILVAFDLPVPLMNKIEGLFPKLEVKKSCNETELLQLIDDANILLTGFFSREIFLKAKKLKWIQATGAGVDKFLFPEVVKSPIVITNAGDIFATPISEHIILLMLSFCRRMPLFTINQSKKKWERYGGFTNGICEELSGKTLGIVGLGKIGSETAKKAKHLGMKILASKKNFNSQKIDYVDKLIPIENLQILLEESDFVIITAPLTKETQGLIGKVQLQYMKKTSYLINVSRGKIINEKELIAALEEHEISGAGLDTFEEEPLPSNSKLWKMKNVIITPHIAGQSNNYLERLTNSFIQNLELFMNNQPLNNTVNKKAGY